MTAQLIEACGVKFKRDVTRLKCQHLSFALMLTFNLATSYYKHLQASVTCKTSLGRKTAGCGHKI